MICEGHDAFGATLGGTCQRAFAVRLAAGVQIGLPVRGISDEHLPVYLDEYVFRHNRRRTPMAAFQTLLGLGAIHPPTTYDQITLRAT